VSATPSIAGDRSIAVTDPVPSRQRNRAAARYSSIDIGEKRGEILFSMMWKIQSTSSAPWRRTRLPARA